MMRVKIKVGIGRGIVLLWVRPEKALMQTDGVKCLATKKKCGKGVQDMSA